MARALDEVTVMSWFFHILAGGIKLPYVDFVFSFIPYLAGFFFWHATLNLAIHHWLIFVLPSLVSFHEKMPSVTLVLTTQI